VNTALKRVVIIFQKEVMDNLRDRRSMISAMLSSLIGPVILIILSPSLKDEGYPR